MCYHAPSAKAPCVVMLNLQGLCCSSAILRAGVCIICRPGLYAPGQVCLCAIWEGGAEGRDPAHKVPGITGLG